MTDQNKFRYHYCVEVSASPDGKVPFVDNVLSSHEQESYPTTSLVENGIELELQTDGNVYVELRQTYLAFKIKLNKGRGFDTYQKTEKKQDHKENNVFTGTGEDDVQFVDENWERVFNITHVSNIQHSIISNAELSINNHQVYKLSELYAQKSHNSNKNKSTLTDYKGVLHCESYDYEEDRENLNEIPLFTSKDCTVNMMVSCCTLSSISIFSEHSNYYIET